MSLTNRITDFFELCAKNSEEDLKINDLIFLILIDFFCVGGGECI